jgi:hypothetical protein
LSNKAVKYLKDRYILAYSGLGIRRMSLFFKCPNVFEEIWKKIKVAEYQEKEFELLKRNPAVLNYNPHKKTK